MRLSVRLCICAPQANAYAIDKHIHTMLCHFYGNATQGYFIRLTPEALLELYRAQCVAVSWNARGAVIAGAFGHNDHESWCTHTGNVSTVR